MAMEIQSDSLQVNKWQRVFNIVSQHPDFLQQNINLQMQRLFLSRLLAENILAFLLQYMGLMFSTLTPTPFPLWFAAGTSCAFIFLRGSTILPGIGLGSFFAYYMANSGISIALGSATVFVCQAQALLWISYRLIYPSLLFYKTTELFTFFFFSALVAAISVFLLVTMYIYTLPNPIDVLQLWLQWWLADLDGILIIASALVTADAYFPQIQDLRKLNKVMLSLLLGVWVVVIIGIMVCDSAVLSSLLAILSLVLIVFIARYYGWCGNIAAVCLFALLTCSGLSKNWSLVSLQILLGIEFMVGAWIAIQRGVR
ncbi:MAG: MASE1 domain-containing protein [Gammaproteobacteria bacterium]